VDLVILDGGGAISLVRGHLKAAPSVASRGAPMGRSASAATKSLTTLNKTEQVWITCDIYTL
jgi:hypothetical protein